MTYTGSHSHTHNTHTPIHTHTPTHPHTHTHHHTPSHTHIHTHTHSPPKKKQQKKTHHTDKHSHKFLFPHACILIHTHYVLYQNIIYCDETVQIHAVLHTYRSVILLPDIDCKGRIKKLYRYRNLCHILYTKICKWIWYLIYISILTCLIFVHIYYTLTHSFLYVTHGHHSSQHKDLKSKYLDCCKLLSHILKMCSCLQAHSTETLRVIKDSIRFVP